MEAHARRVQLQKEGVVDVSVLLSPEWGAPGPQGRAFGAE